MTLKEFTASKYFTQTRYLLGATIVLLGVFYAGITVGYHKAKFSFHMGEDYYRAFEGVEPRDGIRFGMGAPRFPDAHGSVGKIIRVELPTIVVLGRDNIEKVILVTPDTSVQKFRDTASTSALTLGEHVVVIGSPTDGAEITARLIRIIPAPPSAQPTMVTPSSIP